MRTSLATALVAGLLVTGSAMAASAAQAPKAVSAPKTAAHATAAKEKTAMGTVKSVDASTLVLKTRKGDMSFGIASAAHKDTLATGANVTVHYTTAGRTMTVTDVMVSPAKTAKK
jgi:FKBP-type peptidyl-prolyl cis-trans isomerase